MFGGNTALYLETMIVEDNTFKTIASDQSKFHKIATDLASLLEEKDKAYGSAYSKTTEFLKLLFPNGVPPEKYSELLYVTRVFDKLMRVATGGSASEGLKDALKDIAGYSILELTKLEP